MNEQLPIDTPTKTMPEVLAENQALRNLHKTNIDAIGISEAHEHELANEAKHLMVAADIVLETDGPTQGYRNVFNEAGNKIDLSDEHGRKAQIFKSINEETLIDARKHLNENHEVYEQAAPDLAADADYEIKTDPNYQPPQPTEANEPRELQHQ